MNPARHRLFQTLVVSGAMLGGCDAFESHVAPRSSFRFDGGGGSPRDAGRAGQGGTSGNGGVGGFGGVSVADRDAGDADAGVIPCDPIACNCGYSLPECAACETIWCAIT
jgi:hypothetical protein